MPMRPSRHTPQCDRLAHAAKRERDRARGSAAARGYDGRWRKLARTFLHRYPLCADPFGVHATEGRRAFGEHVDHKVPRRAGGSDA